MWTKLPHVVAVLLMVGVLAGCWGNSSEAEARKEKTRARVAAAESVVSKTPVPRTYDIGGNQLVVLDVPMRDSRGYLETQRCFIWRDAEYRTASIQCPSDLQDFQPSVTD